MTLSYPKESLGASSLLPSVFTRLNRSSFERYAREMKRILKPDGLLLSWHFLLNDRSRDLMSANDFVDSFARRSPPRVAGDACSITLAPQSRSMRRAFPRVPGTNGASPAVGPARWLVSATPRRVSSTPRGPHPRRESSVSGACWRRRQTYARHCGSIRLDRCSHLGYPQPRGSRSASARAGTMGGSPLFMSLGGRLRALERWTVRRFPSTGAAFRRVRHTAGSLGAQRW